MVVRSFSDSSSSIYYKYACNEGCSINDENQIDLGMVERADSTSSDDSCSSLRSSSIDSFSGCLSDSDSEKGFVPPSSCNDRLNSFDNEDLFDFVASIFAILPKYSLRDMLPMPMPMVDKPDLTKDNKTPLTSWANNKRRVDGILSRAYVEVLVSLCNVSKSKVTEVISDTDRPQMRENLSFNESIVFLWETLDRGEITLDMNTYESFNHLEPLVRPCTADLIDEKTFICYAWQMLYDDLDVRVYLNEFIGESAFIASQISALNDLARKYFYCHEYIEKKKEIYELIEKVLKMEYQYIESILLNSQSLLTYTYISSYFLTIKSAFSSQLFISSFSPQYVNKMNGYLHQLYFLYVKKMISNSDFMKEPQNCIKLINFVVCKIEDNEKRKEITDELNELFAKAVIDICMKMTTYSDQLIYIRKILHCSLLSCDEYQYFDEMYKRIIGLMEETNSVLCKRFSK